MPVPLHLHIGKEQEGGELRQLERDWSADARAQAEAVTSFRMVVGGQGMVVRRLRWPRCSEVDDQRGV